MERGVLEEDKFVVRIVHEGAFKQGARGNQSRRHERLRILDKRRKEN